mgnify:CR=1 FL=1
MPVSDRMIGGGDLSSASPVTDVNQAYIYCRVAPNTTGGSGAIAAYNASGQILWSWHIWVTDYKPDPRGDVDVQTPVTLIFQVHWVESLYNLLSPLGCDPS